MSLVAFTKSFWFIPTYSLHYFWELYTKGLLFDFKVFTLTCWMTSAWLLSQLFNGPTYVLQPLPLAYKRRRQIHLFLLNACNIFHFFRLQFKQIRVKKTKQLLWPVSASTLIVFRIESEVYETSQNAFVQNYMICATLVLARQRERCFVKNAVKMLEIHNFLSNLIFNLSNFR